jgi:hypothetical protein
VIPPETDYDVVTVDLSTARSDPGTALGITGTSLAVIGITGSAQIKFNSTAKPALSLIGGETWVMNFTEVYLINQAQPGCSLLLWVGKTA